MKYYLVKMLTNTQEQDGSSIAVYNNLTSAQVAYHQTLASYHNAEDVLFAVVKILDPYGNEIPGMSEIVNHIPTPTSEETVDVTNE